MASEKALLKLPKNIQGSVLDLLPTIDKKLSLKKQIQGYCLRALTDAARLVLHRAFISSNYKHVERGAQFKELQLLLVFDAYFRACSSILYSVAKGSK